MKPAELHCWILAWFSMALCCWCTSDTFTQSDIRPRPWNKLYFAHHWPVTVCKMNANDCHDPPMYWTIHGLWPDRAEDCNRTWHFNVTEIKLYLLDFVNMQFGLFGHIFMNKIYRSTTTLVMDLQWQKVPVKRKGFSQLVFSLHFFYCKIRTNKDLILDMRHYWPDVLHSSQNRTQFWKHEWDKHGTCAATLEVLNSQKKYFGKALELYQHVDLNGHLLKAGIKPSSSYYKMTAIKEALRRFYGVTPKIQCLPPEEGEKAQTIGQIEICFTKELQLVNCTELEGESNPMQAHFKLGTSELSVCNDSLPTYYPSELQDHK